MALSRAAPLWVNPTRISFHVWSTDVQFLRVKDGRVDVSTLTTVGTEGSVGENATDLLVTCVALNIISLHCCFWLPETGAALNFPTGSVSSEG